jgi:uncharacterized membrane protein
VAGTGPRNPGRVTTSTTVDIPIGDDGDDGGRGRQPGGTPGPWSGRILRWLGRAALSPCGWLVAAAVAVYGLFNLDMWNQMQVGACDLGIFYQAVHGWAFQGWPYVPIKGYSQLGDHFSPVFLLLAPALWIHDSPATLMAAQVILVCLSAIPVYVAVRRVHGTLPAALIEAAYLASFAVQGTLGFPVHEVMFGAPLIAWGLERALAGRWTWASMVMGATVFVKEDMGVTVAAFGLYALVNGRRRHALWLIVFGLAMFVVCVDVIIPALNPRGFTYSGYYSPNLGGARGLGGEIGYIVTHPFQVVRTMWNTPGKRADWSHLLVPVGFLALASPLALVGLPIMVTRMLSVRDTQWSWQLYYDMPLLPIVYLAALDGYDRIRRLPMLARLRIRLNGHGEWPKRVLATLAAAAAALGVYSIQPTLQVYGWLYLDRDRAAAGYLDQVHTVLRQLPPGVAAQATDFLTVPPAARDTMTVFADSNTSKGNWALIDLDDPGTCGPSTDKTRARAAQLIAQGWSVVAKDGRIELLHKP